MTSLKSKFITWINKCREKQSPSNRKKTEYPVDVLKIKFNVKLAVHKCSSKQAFLKYCKFYKKTLVLESLSDKVEAFRIYYKQTPQHRSFPVKLMKFSRTLYDCFRQVEKCICSTNFYRTTKNMVSRAIFKIFAFLF